MNITRRLFLRTTAAAGVAGPVAASAASPEANPIDAVHHHLREAMRAMQKIDPKVDRYSFDEQHCVVVMSSGIRRGYLLDGSYHDKDWR